MRGEDIAKLARTVDEETARIQRARDEGETEATIAQELLLGRVRGGYRVMYLPDLDGEEIDDDVVCSMCIDDFLAAADPNNSEKDQAAEDEDRCCVCGRVIYVETEAETDARRRLESAQQALHDLRLRDLVSCVDATVARRGMMLLARDGGEYAVVVGFRALRRGRMCLYRIAKRDAHGRWTMSAQMEKRWCYWHPTQHGKQGMLADGWRVPTDAERALYEASR